MVRLVAIKSITLSLSSGSRLLFASAALLHPFLEALLLGLDVLGHQPTALFDFSVGAFNHALYYYFGLGVELVQLDP